MQEKKTKIVLDTNVLISSIISKDGTPAKVIEKLKNKKIINYTTETILEELEEVINRPKIKKNTQQHETKFFQDFIAAISIIIEPTVKIDEIKEDTADNKFLECALEAKADYIISGDKHPLKQEKYKKTRIVNCKQSLELTQ